MSGKTFDLSSSELVEAGNELAHQCMTLQLEIVKLRHTNQMSKAQCEAFEACVEWNRLLKKAEGK